MDNVAPQGASDADPMAKALETVKAMDSECPGHAVLVNLLEAADGDRDRLRKSLEDWYDDTMDRVSGWYKRYIQRIVLVLSVVLVSPPKLRPLTAVLGAMFAAAIGCVLLILAWHMPSDVIGGYLISLLWMSIAVASLRAAERRWPTGRSI